MFKHHLIKLFTTSHYIWLFLSILSCVGITILIKEQPNSENINVVIKVYALLVLISGLATGAIFLISNDINKLNWVARQKINKTKKTVYEKPLKPKNQELIRKFEDFCINPDIIKSYNNDDFSTNRKHCEDMKKFSQLNRNDFDESYIYYTQRNNRYTLISEDEKICLLSITHQVREFYTYEYGNFDSKLERFKENLSNYPDFNSFDSRSSYDEPSVKYYLNEWFIVFDNIVAPISIGESRDLISLFDKEANKQALERI